jgi:hypothetical protein
LRQKNVNQAKALIRLAAVGNINLTVDEAKQRNSAKGVIYAPALRYDDETVLLEYLKGQNVMEIKMLPKFINGVECKTGTIFVTFGTPNVPESVNIGYLRLRVREFIPIPL